MRRLTTTFVLVSASALALAGTALAGGGDYEIRGGTAAEDAEVVAALDASAFDWDLVPAQVTIHIDPATQSYAVPGEIWLNARLLDTGRFAWGVVQHEYAHQVDFFLFDDATRARMNALLHGVDWFGVTSPHHLRGVERFASTLAWSYWPAPQSALKPASNADEAAAMRPSRFRALMTKLLGTPQIPSSFVPRHALSFGSVPLRPGGALLRFL